MHALAIVLVTVFLGFGWWQLQRAADGNMRSWGYTFEWPLFAVFVLVMWIKMIYDELHADKDEADTREAASSAGSPAAVAIQDAQNGEDDPELAAYNRYLARLNAQALHRR